MENYLKCRNISCVLMDKIHNLKIEITRKIGFPTCSSLACFCFGLTRRGDSDDKKDVPLVSV